MLTVENLLYTVRGGGFGANSIRNLAYELQSKSGERSDAKASAIADQIRSGQMTTQQAECLVFSCELNISVYEEIEAFLIKSSGQQ